MVFMSDTIIDETPLAIRFKTITNPSSPKPTFTLFLTNILYALKAHIWRIQSLAAHFAIIAEDFHF